MVRAVLAILACLLVAASAAAPHHHDSRLGDHGCAACVSSGAEVARDETPSVEAREGMPEAPHPAPGLAPVAGAPMGAVPGQSPPHV